MELKLSQIDDAKNNFMKKMKGIQVSLKSRGQLPRLDMLLGKETHHS